MPVLGEAAPKDAVTGKSLEVMVRAVVLETPASTAVALRVLRWNPTLEPPRFDQNAVYEVQPGQWGGTPVEGEIQLMAFDETGDEWIVAGSAADFS